MIAPTGGAGYAGVTPGGGATGPGGWTVDDRVDVDVAGRTHVGHRRDRNEDQFLVADLSKALTVRASSLAFEDQTALIGGVRGALLVVADGMGGHVGGQRASRVAVQALQRYVLHTMSWFFRLDEGDGEALEGQLVAAVERCQQALEQQLDADDSREGMGTTLTLAYVAWPWTYVVHVGDTRCYLLREGQLHQLTRDQTVAQVLLDEGVFDEHAAEESPTAHMLSQALVAKRDNEMSPEVYRSSLELGDTLVLCSDGLTKHVDDDTIARLTAAAETADGACEALVDAALEGGGSDNVTVVVARYTRPRG